MLLMWGWIPSVCVIVVPKYLNFFTSGYPNSYFYLYLVAFLEIIKIADFFLFISIYSYWEVFSTILIAFFVYLLFMHISAISSAKSLNCTPFSLSFTAYSSAIMLKSPGDNLSPWGVPFLMKDFLSLCWMYMLEWMNLSRSSSYLENTLFFSNNL